MASTPPLDLRKIVRDIELTNSCGKKFLFSFKEIAESPYIINDPGSPTRPPGSRKFFLGVFENKANNCAVESPIRPPGSRKFWPDIVLKNSCGQQFQFSARKVPKCIYNEILDYMCTYFNRKEIMPSSSIQQWPNYGNNYIVKELSHDNQTMRRVWETILEKGLSIAAFLKENERNYCHIAAVDVLLVMDDNTQSHINDDNISNKKKNMFGFLTVHPNFRGLGLGKMLLEIRNEIEREYGITDSIDFEEVFEYSFEDYDDDDDDDDDDADNEGLQ